MLLFIFYRYLYMVSAAINTPPVILRLAHLLGLRRIQARSAAQTARHPETRRPARLTKDPGAKHRTF